MSGFRTKLDFSDNRQAKQRPITRTVLSGGTSFGLPFNLLPSGPNLTTSAITGNYTYIASTFSGNNTTTVYNWSDPRMQLGVSALSALTSSTSGLTQNTGAVWTPNTTTVIDGNTVALTYSGVNFDISVVTIAQLTPSTYSGTITTNNFDVYTASTLDYTGRTIWVDVSGITRTEKLIISDNPQVGYVWTCLDSEGMGGWVFNSSATTATIWTAGTGANSAVLGGSNGIASGSTSVSEGVNTRAGGIASHAEGGGTQALGDLSHAEGEDTIASNTAAHAEGVNTIASGVYSHAEGSNTIASNARSHAEGYLSIASGVVSHAEGESTTASGGNSHAEGHSTIASGNTSHAEGGNTVAGGGYSHAEGKDTIASGYRSHAEGNITIASGDTSHAEGSGSIAGGDSSHAEGSNTIASASQSHAEGSSTIASGSTSHAEGQNTIAGGSVSHAEGSGTIASGFASHAEGSDTIAYGTNSHAGGYSSRTDSNYSFIHSNQSVISSGGENSYILGGKENYIELSDYSGILGGRYNILGIAQPGFNANAENSFIGGGYSNIIYEATNNSTILGGRENEIHKYSNDSAIVGGRNNEISGGSISSGIFVGTGNTISNISKYAAIIAGRNNTISGHSNSVIVGGFNNFIDFCLNNYGDSSNESIIGGANNSIYVADNSFIAGGNNNLIDGRTAGIGSVSSFILGGVNCSAFTSVRSGIIGGLNNSIKPSYCSYVSSSIIIGGEENEYNPSTSLISGSGARVTIIGGYQNKVTGEGVSDVSIFGGYKNLYTSHVGNGGNANTIVGGSGNTMNSRSTYFGQDISYASILGGAGNNISSDVSVASVLQLSSYSNITGGFENTITGSSNSFIGGGTGNVIKDAANDSVILGGKLNSIERGFANYATTISSAIIAGSGNTINGHFYSAILAGMGNTIHFDLAGTEGKSNETILGGAFNTISASTSSSIVGGTYNEIQNYTSSIILGGLRNRLLDFSTDTIYNSGTGGDNVDGNDVTNFSTIIGGVDNTITGKTAHCTILGGSGNTINGHATSNTNYNSAIIGGRRNVINQYVSRSVILGGSDITATTSDYVYVPNLIVNSGGTASKLGINTKTPEYVIDARANNARLVLADIYTGDDLPFKSFVFSANSTNVPQIAAATNSYLGGFGLSLQMGVLGDDSISTATSELVGLSGDTYLSSSQKTNNLNIINRSGGSGTNNIRMYAGINSVSAAAVPDFQIQGDGTNRGYIGIQTGNPQYLIDARGTGNRLFYSSTGVGNITLSATTGLPSVGVVAGTANTANKLASISMGARAWDDAIYTVYGYQGDAFIYAGIFTNGLNIISNDGSTSGTGADYIRFYAGQTSGAGASNNPDLHIQGSGSSRGYVAINVPHNQDPTQRLDVNGNARFRGVGSSASAGALHYTSDGTLTTNTSDERLKTNIETLTNALDKVNQLRGVKYNWTEEPNGDVRIGLIAQEVNSIVPELTFVNKNTEEEYMGVHYDNVVALLIEAVKELSSGVTTSNNTHLETQTILAEDNNIELNFNGTQETSLGGGLSVLHAKGQDQSADLITDANGNFITNNDFKPNALTIPLYTPTSSNDTAGSEGNITRDDNYMYVKTSTGWKRTNLENF